MAEIRYHAGTDDRWRYAPRSTLVLCRLSRSVSLKVKFGRYTRGL